MKFGGLHTNLVGQRGLCTLQRYQLASCIPTSFNKEAGRAGAAPSDAVSNATKKDLPGDLDEGRRELKATAVEVLCRNSVAYRVAEIHLLEVGVVGWCFAGACSKPSPSSKGRL